MHRTRHSGQSRARKSILDALSRLLVARAVPLACAAAFGANELFDGLQVGELSAVAVNRRTGDAYFGCAAGIARLGADGRASFVTTAEPLASPAGLCVSADGASVFVCSGQTCAIYALSLCDGSASHLAGEEGFHEPSSHSASSRSASDEASGEGDSGEREPATRTRLFGPMGLACSSEALFIAEFEGHCIRRLALPAGPESVLSVLAGRRGVSGARDGAGGEARFYFPASLCLSRDERTLYVGQRACIRAVDLATWAEPEGARVTTLASTPRLALDPAAGSAFAQGEWYALDALALDDDDVLYAADSAAGLVRCVWPSGAVGVLAPGLGLVQPHALALSGDGSVFVLEGRAGGLVRALRVRSAPWSPALHALVEPRLRACIATVLLAVRCGRSPALAGLRLGDAELAACFRAIGRLDALAPRAALAPAARAPVEPAGEAAGTCALV